LNTSDLNECATLYQSILNLKESGSEEEVKAATDDFQAKLAQIITKYHHTVQRLLFFKRFICISNWRNSTTDE
jgi:hypothetical protein